MIDKLRPLTLGEILDRTAQLYRRNFLTFAGVSAVPMIATFAVFVPIGVAMAYMGIFNPAHATPSTGALIAIFSVALVVGLPVALVAGVMMQAALTKTAIGAHMDQKVKVREAIGFVWPRFWRYLWLIVLLGLLVIVLPSVVAGATTLGVAIPAGIAGAKGAGAGAGFAALFVLMFLAVFVYAVWRCLCYALAFPACIVEEKSAWQSIKRANRLSKGTRGRIFVMYLLMFAISMVIAIVSDVFMFVGVAIATALGGAKLGPVVAVVGVVIALLGRIALQVLIEPLPVIALVLFYYDQRVRTEGYDIELMMEQAGLTAPPLENPEVLAEPQSATPIPVPIPTPIIESPLKPSFDPGPSPDTVKEQ
jgi:hypothetical protein